MSAISEVLCATLLMSAASLLLSLFILIKLWEIEWSADKARKYAFDAYLEIRRRRFEAKYRRP